MLKYIEFLVLIDSLALFFQGFSFRRRHIPIFLISSFIILLMLGLNIILEGIGIYVNNLSNIDMHDAIVSIVYVLFWLISGYIVGGFQRVADKKVKKIKVTGENIIRRERI